MTENQRKRKYYGIFRDSSSPNLSIYGQVDSLVDETVTVHNMEPRNVREKATYIDKGKSTAISSEPTNSVKTIKLLEKEKAKENIAPQESHVKEKTKNLDKGKAIAISSQVSLNIGTNVISKSALAQRLRRDREKLQRVSRIQFTPKYFPSIIPTGIVLPQSETYSTNIILTHLGIPSHILAAQPALPKATKQSRLPRLDCLDIHSELPPRNLNVDFESVITRSPTISPVHDVPNEVDTTRQHSIFEPGTSSTVHNMPTTALPGLTEVSNLEVLPVVHVHEERYFLGQMDVLCPFCKALHWKDEKLTKSSNTRPLFGTCCLQGKIKLPLLIEPPEAFKGLYDGNDAYSKHFRKFIREYNASNAFTSLGSTMEPRVLNGRGPTSFTIHGELRHRTGSLIPEAGLEASYAQLYIFHPNTAIDCRKRRDPRLEVGVLKVIQDVLLQNNKFVRVYSQAYEILMQSNATNETLPAYLHYNSSTDRRRYNLPSTDEIAVILPGDGTEKSGMRDIVIHLKGGNGLMKINECHPAYLPLHYVLLFPYGEFGWDPTLTQWDVINNKSSANRLTQMQWYSYRCFDRPTEYTTILKAGKLFQEFLVDAWAATEQNRLTYYRLNQAQLRAELYKGLTDIEESGLEPHQVGQLFILPSSFTGSPRMMFELYQDSLAITSYNKHPDLFITMTANPHWPEIMSALLPNQTSLDRPDLVARVFELKRKHLMKLIEKHGILGQTVGHVFTIEFQKRGLPHMHALIFFRQSDKVRTVDQIDRLVSAEFPDPKEDPLLFETVKSCMVHGPCGTRDKHAVCMEDGRCTKRFPRMFTESTTIDVDGYPIYRRRDTGKVYTVKGHHVDNRDIVPYNAYLSKLFNCHINVEVCAGLRCVKYIHKYIFKGYDRATFVLGRLDEIQQYLDARYIGPPEAAWRIFGHTLHEEIPSVVRLAVHLPGMHRVLFNPDDSRETILTRAEQQTSILLAFFKCCVSNEEPRAFTYQEFPEHFVWNRQQHLWTSRKKGFAIGRMYFASPNCGERFYLRLLLTIVRGPQSFECLRTVNGVLCETFKLACVARGFLEDNGEWVQCLEEVIKMKTGHQLRKLFVVILLHCFPPNPDHLWNQFSLNICDDLAHKLRTVFGIITPSENQITDYGLYLINKLLQQSGKDLTHFKPMPLSTGNWNDQPGNRLLLEHRMIQHECQAVDVQVNIERLNDEQSFAYMTILNSVTNNKGTVFFLSGGAGTGKTFLYNTIATKCRSMGHIVITVASSGIASLLLVGGRTAHSTFCIPLDILDNSICGFHKQSIHAELFRETKLIIWDEVPMQHRFCVEAVDRTLQDIRDNKNPFGGVTVVLGGDFRQILPVIPKGVREQIVGASLKRSPLWLVIVVLTLSLNMRLADTEPGNADFAKFLVEIGSNPCEIVQLPLVHRCKNLSELLCSTYPGLNILGTSSPKYLTERAILSPRNDDVGFINSEALKIFPGETIVYLAADKLVEEGEDNRLGGGNYPNEYLNSLDPPGLPPFRLQLKVGCPVMLLRNLAPKDGLCNGTRLIVVRCAPRIIEAQIITGDKSGDLVFLPRISLTTSSVEVPVRMTRRQFPIRLTYAMTINKSQGQFLYRIDDICT